MVLDTIGDHYVVTFFGMYQEREDCPECLIGPSISQSCVSLPVKVHDSQYFLSRCTTRYDVESPVSSEGPSSLLSRLQTFHPSSSSPSYEVSISLQEVFYRVYHRLTSVECVRVGTRWHSKRRVEVRVTPV